MVTVNPQLNQRLRSFGTTIFAEMSALAVATDSINLGQGFPDTDGPDVVKRAAIDAIEAGFNQYPPGIGVPALREAVAAHQSRFYGQVYDPDTEVREKAVFALSQLPRDQGVPLLIDVARSHRDPEVRKKAMFWLGQSNDTRALAFIEDVLTR